MTMKTLLTVLSSGEQKGIMVHSPNKKGCGNTAATVGERLHMKHEGETHAQPRFRAPREAIRLLSRISSPIRNLHVSTKLHGYSERPCLYVPRLRYQPLSLSRVFFGV